jgi:hypothetical protein
VPLTLVAIGMTDGENITRQTPLVLLCLGDVGAPDALTPLTPIFGQPLIFHLINRLEQIGLSKFYIGVDAVPGALIAHRDRMAAAGSQIDFIRNPSDLADVAGADSNVLVLRADMLCDRTLIERAISEKAAFVATVEERAENGAFERIDLNHRWAGLALLKAKTAQAIVALPEGWDMASALLRQAVQEGTRFWPIRQTELVEGAIRPLSAIADIGTAQAAIAPVVQDQSKTLDALLLAKPAMALTARLWSVEWGRNAALYLFPATGLIAMLLGGSGLWLSAALCALFAICTYWLRDAVRRVEYRGDQFDKAGALGWLFLAIMLPTILVSIAGNLPEAAFLGFLLSAFALIGMTQTDQPVICSPLVTSLTLIIGLLSGATKVLIALLIAAEVAMMLVRSIQSRTGRGVKQT